MPAIEHLQCLGVTTVELMPVHAFVNVRSLAEKRLQNYHQHKFPLDPRTYAAVLEGAMGDAALVPAHRVELESVCKQSAEVPDRADRARETVFERRRQVASLKARLRGVANDVPQLAATLQAQVERLNQHEQCNTLDDIHSAQAYRLAYWRIAGSEINYRRFFDVNDLAALCVEHEDVFEATHGLALDLAAAGLIDSLRIDHPDGLPIRTSISGVCSRVMRDELSMRGACASTRPPASMSSPKRLLQGLKTYHRRGPCKARPAIVLQWSSTVCSSNAGPANA